MTVKIKEGRAGGSSTRPPHSYVHSETTTKQPIKQEAQRVKRRDAPVRNIKTRPVPQSDAQ